MDRARPKSKICAKQRLYVKQLAQCHPVVTQQSSGTLNVELSSRNLNVELSSGILNTELSFAVHMKRRNMKRLMQCQIVTQKSHKHQTIEHTVWYCNAVKVNLPWVPHSGWHQYCWASDPAKNQQTGLLWLVQLSGLILCHLHLW